MSGFDYCAEKGLSVREVMKKLDNLEIKTLFVTENGKLVGTITDGDIRRYLLSGGSMDDDAFKAANKNPKSAETAKKAELIMREYKVTAVPIINRNCEVIDVYYGKSHLEKQLPKLNIPVVINAGGKGTRLEPFTRVLPKPLIPIGDFPIIEHIIQQFKKFSCNDYHIIVNYKKQLIKAYFSEIENKYNICFYDEDKPLGTGGGLSLLKGQIKETFFFTNCDVLLRSDYESMLRFHKENGNAVTIICAYKNLKIPYGVIETGENGSIVNMKEKPEISFLTNTGMYIVEPEILDDIKEDISIGFPDIIEAQRTKGRKVAVYPISESEWMDMGEMSGLEDMREKMHEKIEG